MSPARRLLCFVAVALWLGACGTPSTPARTPAVLEPWQGDSAKLFDDGLSPTALGLRDGLALEEKGLLHKRSFHAATVVRVRVVTVTARAHDNAVRYFIALQPVGKPIAGSLTADQPLTLVVDKNSPAFGLVRSRDLQLTGQSFVLLAKPFAGPDGPTLHWHLAPDTPESLELIRRSIILSDLSGA